MGLETRGNNVVVTSGNGVLVSDIADSLIDGKEFTWMMNRFPVSYEELWEVIDFYAEKVPTRDDNFELHNLGTDTDIDIEVSKVSDHMFFALVAFGKVFVPQSDDLKYLFSRGLEMTIIEVCEELLETGSIDGTSNMHSIVHNELTNVIGQFDPSEVLASITSEINDDDYNNNGVVH